MKLNEKLNLVIPMTDDNGNEYYLHTTPLSPEAFNANYLLLSQGFSFMVEQAVQITAGPKIANLVLRDLAERQGRSEVYEAIIAEIKRITTVIKQSENGWEPLPLSSAIARKVINEKELDEAMNFIVFFILTSALMSGQKLTASLEYMNGLWGSQNTSLTSTGWRDSLPILTGDESSGATVTAS